MSAPTSPVAICNMSLALLRQEPISNLTDPSTKQEKLCALFYEQTRQETLRKHTWNFAIKRAMIAASATVPAFGFSTKFVLPNDYVRLVGISDDEIDYPYEIENHELLIDYESTALPLRYIYDHSQINRWDPLFTKCFVLELAIVMGPQATGSLTVSEKLQGMLDSVAPDAYAVDGQERPPKRIQRSRALQARRGLRSRRADIVGG